MVSELVQDGKHVAAQLLWRIILENSDNFDETEHKLDKLLAWPVS